MSDKQSNPFAIRFGLESFQDAIKDHCSHLKHGKCSALQCFKLAGYRRGFGSPIEQGIEEGTCVWRQLHEYLESLRNHI